MKQYLTSKIGLLVLFVICNVSIYANEGNDFNAGTDGLISSFADKEIVDGQDDHQLLRNTYSNLSENTRIELTEAVLKKAKYYFEGSGKTEVVGFQCDYSDNIVIDAIVEPRSVKKRCSIAAQRDGQNGYRLIQDGRDVVFEIAIDGSLHKVTASDVLERGESVYLSAYYKNGIVGVLVNGKAPVKEVFQITRDKIASLKTLGVESTIINHLSAIKDEVFFETSDFKKTLRKQLGRKAYRRYGDEIVQLAYGNVEQAGTRRSVSGEISLADVPLVVGSDFSGVVEQIRIWQPAKARCMVAMDYAHDLECDGELSSERSSRVDLKFESTLTSLKSLTCSHTIDDQLTFPETKHYSCSTVLSDSSSTNHQNCPTSFNQKSNDKVLATSSYISNSHSLKGEENSFIDLDECFSSKTKDNGTQLFHVQHGILYMANEGQGSTFLGMKKNRGLAEGVEVWNSEAVDYDNLEADSYQQNFLAENIIFESNELKFIFGSNNQLTTEVNKFKLFDGQKLRRKKKLPFYINNQVNYVFDGNNSPADRLTKINESEKLKRSTGDVKSEWLSVINGCFEKFQESIECKYSSEIGPGDTVNYVSHDRSLVNWVSVRHSVNLILGLTGNDYYEIHEGPYEDIQTRANLKVLKRSWGPVFDYHNRRNFLSLLKDEPSYGSEKANLGIAWNHAIINEEYLKTSIGCGYELISQNFEISMAVHKQPPVIGTHDFLCASGRNWEDRQLTDSDGKIVASINSSGLTIMDDMLTDIGMSYSVKFVSRDENDIEPSPPPEWWQHNCSTGRVNGRHDIRGADLDVSRLLYVPHCVV
ncbi:MAG: hypothetical protein JEZ14_11875 [Marinilabiliaceae bacterium]|nr:hypothetical protein [Marinilabiliaceae bacterium]